LRLFIETHVPRLLQVWLLVEATAAASSRFKWLTINDRPLFCHSFDSWNGRLSAFTQTSGVGQCAVGTIIHGAHRSSFPADHRRLTDMELAPTGMFQLAKKREKSSLFTLVDGCGPVGCQQRKPKCWLALTLLAGRSTSCEYFDRRPTRSQDEPGR
jgi:hypothetical protein